MIKSIIVVSIICSAVSTSPECYAQEPVEAKPVSAGHATTPSPATNQVPLANLFPTRDPAAVRDVNSVVVAPVSTPRQEAAGMQHEFHGGITSIFGTTNKTPH